MQASKTQHKTIPNTALAFVTNTSPTSASAQWVGGTNALTSIKGQAELRPGFPTSLEPSPIALGDGETIRRVFFWQKWGGQHYAMYSTVDASNSYVYKLAIGINLQAVKIFTSASTTPFTYETANDNVYFGNGTDMLKFRATSTADTEVYKWGIAAPAAAPSVSLGGTGINASTGYYYCRTNWNDNTSHESGPSPLSACTGTFTNKTATITWTDDNDGGGGVTNQITHNKIYRTTDGGSTDTTKMQLVAKVAVGVQTLADATADASLSSEYAPARNYNDPPPASRVGCYSQGRIALFVNSTVWLTGYEEISKGVPEECVPGATLGIFGGGNAWNYGKPVNAVKPLSDGFSVWQGLRIDGIQGDSLDTFRRYNILMNRGVTNDANVSVFGSDSVWFDTSGQVWHSNIGEIGRDIRPTIQGIDQTQSAIAIHISGPFHHIYLQDGANGKLYCYDLDTRQWMPPWTVGATCSALTSGETAAGTVDLVVARNKTKVLKQNKTTYNDDGNTYAASLTLGLVHVSQTSQLLERYDRANPQWRGRVDNVELKTNSVTATGLTLLMDDDPTLQNGTSIVSGAEDLPDVLQGSSLIGKRYPVGTLMEAANKSSLGRMASITMNWAASSSPFQLYYVDIAYYPYAS